MGGGENRANCRAWESVCREDQIGFREAGSEGDRGKLWSADGFQNLHNLVT